MPSTESIDEKEADVLDQHFTILDENGDAIRLRGEELLKRFTSRYSHDESFQELFSFDRGASVYGCISRFRSLLKITCMAGKCVCDITLTDPLLWYGKEEGNLGLTKFIVTFCPASRNH